MVSGHSASRAISSHLIVTDPGHAADCAHVTDARLGDFTKGFVEQGIVLLHGFR